MFKKIARDFKDENVLCVHFTDDDVGTVEIHVIFFFFPPAKSACSCCH